MYVFGGAGDHDKATMRWAECYDPKEDQWHAVKDLPVPGLTCAVAVGRHIYVLLMGKQVFRYDPETDTYVKLARFPLPEWFCFTAVAVGTKIYVIGGAVKGRWTNAAYCYDVTTNIWQELPSMAITRRRCAAAVISMSKEELDMQRASYSSWAAENALSLAAICTVGMGVGAMLFTFAKRRW